MVKSWFLDNFDSGPTIVPYLALDVGSQLFCVAFSSASYVKGWVF